MSTPLLLVKVCVFPSLLVPISWIGKFKLPVNVKGMLPVPVISAPKMLPLVEVNCNWTLAFSRAVGTNTTDMVHEAPAANVQLQFTSTNGSIFGAEITGTGNIPFTLTGSLNFPIQLIGTKSEGKTQTFTNNSGVDIYFTSISRSEERRVG